MKKPSIKTLKRLFAATGVFRKLAPWRWMGDREVVAVRDPSSDRIAYCVAMGFEETCFGLEAMMGDRGLSAYRKVISCETDPMGTDALFIKDSIVLFLEESKESLYSEDLELLKRAGVKWSGEHAWPCFHRFEPGFCPWTVNDQDAVFMAVCLEQVVEVALRSVKDQDILGPGDHRTFVCRVPVEKDGVLVWQEEFITPEPMERMIRIYPGKQDLVNFAETLWGAEKSGMTWEADCFFAPVPVGDKGARPRYPFCYMIADENSGFVFNVDLAENDYGAGFIRKMAEVIKKHKAMPSKIHVRHPYLADFFAPLLSLGIETDLVKTLPAIDEAREEMFRVMEQGFGAGEASEKKNKKTSDTKSKQKTKKTKVQKKRGGTSVGKNMVYQFRISLNDVSPAVWRRFQVTNDITLHRLSTTILMVMDWSGGHLHQFRINETEYGVPHEDDFSEIRDEREIRLCDFSQEAFKSFTYEYDFGDGWEHELILEKVLEAGKRMEYPVCIDGARACPPEDCGGPQGYAGFLAVIRNPKHPEHESMLDWVGGDFDPEEFYPEVINEDLDSIEEEEKFIDSFIDQ